MLVKQIKERAYYSRAIAALSFLRKWMDPAIVGTFADDAITRE